MSLRALPQQYSWSPGIFCSTCWHLCEEERCRRRSRSPAVILWSLSRPICLFSRWGTLRQHHTGGLVGSQRRVTFRTPAAPGPVLVRRHFRRYIFAHKWHSAILWAVNMRHTRDTYAHKYRWNLTISSFIRAWRLNTSVCVRYIARRHDLPFPTAREYLPNLKFIYRFINNSLFQAQCQSASRRESVKHKRFKAVTWLLHSLGKLFIQLDVDQQFYHEGEISKVGSARAEGSPLYVKTLKLERVN